jgi:tRNA A37 threonylcarbamoyladenosine modification protein TsaB
VALAAAKGLGLSLGLAPIGLSSLTAMAYHDADGESFMISAIDSRRKTQYIQGFSPDFNKQTKIMDGGIEEMLGLASGLGEGSFIINGHNASAYVDVLTRAGFKARIGEAVFPTAGDLCRYHHAYPDHNDGLEPLYLAPPLVSTPK